jgi:hypothetical protein
MDQQEHDRRSLAWHRLVVQRMQGDPTLLDRSRITLARWMADGPAPNRLYLAEWQAALDKGIVAVAQLALGEDEHACALRQCSPISCQMSNEERWAFRRQWRASGRTSTTPRLKPGA